MIDKPVGPTSHDIVDAVRRSLGVRRVGHAGTLDPPASGLLVVAAGPATRLLRYVQDLPKTYEVTAQLGVRTTTLDAAGEEVSRDPVSATAPDIRAAASELTGEIEQVPPAVSAVKVGGERAYRKARRGESVELPLRRVTVYSFDVLRTSPDTFDARIACSSGTYVRSLVADLGDRLGCGAHVVHLRRVAIGHLSVADAVGIAGIGEGAVRGVEEVLAHLPRVDVGAEEAESARNGRPVDAPASAENVLLCGPDGAIGVFTSRDGRLRAVTVLGR